MSTNEISILDEIMESTVKKRRWYMLPLYCRLIVIAGTIIGGIINSLMLIAIFITPEGKELLHLDVAFSAALGFSILIIFFLGNLLLWLEKKYAIYWGYASSISAIIITLGVANMLNEMIKTPMAAMLPIVLLYASFIFQLRKIRTNWKKNGADRKELS